MAQRQVLDSLGSLELRFVVSGMYTKKVRSSNGKHNLSQESVAFITQNFDEILRNT
jgi:hypothetical protein